MYEVKTLTSLTYLMFIMYLGDINSGIQNALILSLLNQGHDGQKCSIHGGAMTCIHVVLKTS